MDEILVNLDRYIRQLFGNSIERCHYRGLYNLLADDEDVELFLEFIWGETREYAKQDFCILMDKYTNDLNPFAHSQRGMDALHKRLSEIRNWNN